MYLDRSGVAPPLFHIIERCCRISKGDRYQTLAELKQSLAAAYDVLLQRAGGLGKVKQLLSSIGDSLGHSGNYNQQEVTELIEQLALVDEREQVRICQELPTGFFDIISQGRLLGDLATFLGIYEKLVESQDYSWSYAETIAINMRKIFNSQAVPNDEKTRALHLAIRAAYYMNRFAAMDTCRSMITAIRDEGLGLRIASVLMENRDTFVSGIEPSECHCSAVAAALHQIQQQ